LIYVVQALDGGPVKIGCSDNVPVRIKQLETHYGQPLALLATMEGGKDEERTIHARFAEHRLGRSELFRPVAEIMAFIGRPLLVSPDPDAAIAMRGGFTTLQIRVSDEYAEWLDGVAKHYRTTVAGLFDRTITEWTEVNGYSTRPPDRLP
jgi:hypothetical protein